MKAYCLSTLLTIGIQEGEIIETTKNHHTVKFKNRTEIVLKSHIFTNKRDAYKEAAHILYCNISKYNRDIEKFEKLRENLLEYLETSKEKFYEE